MAPGGDARISTVHARVVTGSARFARHLRRHGDSCSTQTPTPGSWAKGRGPDPTTAPRQPRSSSSSEPQARVLSGWPRGAADCAQAALRHLQAAWLPLASRRRAPGRMEPAPGGRQGLSGAPSLPAPAAPPAPGQLLAAAAGLQCEAGGRTRCAHQHNAGAGERPRGEPRLLTASGDRPPAPTCGEAARSLCTQSRWCTWSRSRQRSRARAMPRRQQHDGPSTAPGLPQLLCGHSAPVQRGCREALPVRPPA